MPATFGPMVELKKGSTAKTNSKSTSRSISIGQLGGMSHESQLTNLVRIEGQVRGVARMITEKRYCTEILTQIKAISAALRSVEVNIAEQHLQGCISRAIASGDPRATETALAEVSQLLKSTSR